MAVLNGADVDILVETTTPDTYVPINDMNTFSKSSSRETNKYPVLMRSTPYAFTGLRDQTYDLSGYLNPDDAGQVRLRLIESTNSEVKIKVLFDGVNGFTQMVKVSSYTYDATPEGLQEHGFELAATADAAIVGTGPLL